MRKILAIISIILLLSACNLVETAIIENVKYVDSDPFENCISYSYGVFEKENGEQFKLPVSDEILARMVEGTTYDIEYETKSINYPSNKAVNFLIN